MKIIIEGSQKELAELLIKFSGTKDLPPLLTDLVKDERINDLTEAIQNTYKENAPQEEAAERQENQGLSREEAKAIINGMDTAAKEALKFQYHTP